jgi:prefoldin subunit 5
MALFGKKKEEQHEERSEGDIDAIKAFIEGANRDIHGAATDGQDQGNTEPEQEVQIHAQHKQRHEQMQKPVKQDAPAHEHGTAPLFIKLDKYRDVLVSLGHIKATIVALKNSFDMLQDLDSARAQTTEVMQKAIQKVEARVATLDQELVKPKGFRETSVPKDYEEVETVEATIADLKGQIESLREELQQLS